MTLHLKKFRELVFQILYSFDMGAPSDEDTVTLMMKELNVTRKHVIDALSKVHQIRQRQNEIDDMIAKTSQSYEFGRIQKVELNILRLSAYELLFDNNIPPKVAISEGLRLAKKFSTPESSAFVNAILDNLYKASTGEQINLAELSESINQLEESEEIAQQAALEKKTESEEEEIID